MNDRTLLELAARAAGYKLSWSYDNHCCWINEMRHDFDVTWNPRDDDGDALRLAVKLGLTVDIDLDESWTEIDYTADYQDKEIREGHGGGTDPYGATRLAIVRAAAEIGKSMGGGE
ncbi:TPA: hypothetical protein L6A55_25820 [Pseudomonas aeruginosa]|uniref:hypothetical protein n=1 Tax=Pseudomonas aeruginosa TaxID=287 RepID=UPI00027B66E6|nr:hypothetical protein [Pseudomonas aeruginosa]AFQ22089.1 hypothetical protein BPPAE11_00640 [Pseudomonas phage YMC/01/01/P52_PAE_BP]RSZ53020.1 hypothetical protein EJU38_10060 [Pseudomonas aeruginosa]HBP5595369.1 hypothetical protein [Pseudomonas aeruginosa]HBP5634272.1 hypothetical protein [Pseudomonas aeruginosa]HBP5640779.1 hypothetical protein [Pseudomonas aeruginosa]